jgi:hypothetical protein
MHLHDSHITDYDAWWSTSVSAPAFLTGCGSSLALQAYGLT